MYNNVFCEWEILSSPSLGYVLTNTSIIDILEGLLSLMGCLSIMGYISYLLITGFYG